MHNSTDTSLPDLLRLRRIAMGMSQTKLGRKIDAGTATVSGWETGSRTPRPSVIPQLSSALQIDVELLARLVMAASR